MWTGNLCGYCLSQGSGILPVTEGSCVYLKTGNQWSCHYPTSQGAILGTEGQEAFPIVVPSHQPLLPSSSHSDQVTVCLTPHKWTLPIPGGGFGVLDFVLIMRTCHSLHLNFSVK